MATHKLANRIAGITNPAQVINPDSAGSVQAAKKASIPALAINSVRGYNSKDRKNFSAAIRLSF